MRHRNKRQPTRKQTALRRLALAAVLAVLLLVFRGFAFLPSQAVYRAEEFWNTGRTETVQWKVCAPEQGEFSPVVVYLSEKGDTVLLTAASFSLPGGWGREYVTKAVDCPPDTPLYGRMWRNGNDRAYGFLRVSDPEIVKLDIELQGLVRRPMGGYDRETGLRLESGAAAWQPGASDRYLLLVQDLSDRQYVHDNGRVCLNVTAYDEAGAVVARYDSYDEVGP